MIDIEVILDNINEYKDDIDNLVSQLKVLGVNSLDDLKEHAKSLGVAIPNSIQIGVNNKFQSSDDDDWMSALSQNTLESYQDYLDKHSAGKHREEARENKRKLEQVKIDESTESVWLSVNKDNRDSLKKFIEDYPNNHHVQEARELIKQIDLAELTGMDIEALKASIKAINTDKTINDKPEAIFQHIRKYINNHHGSNSDIVEAIANDHNFISSKVAKLLYDRSILSIEDYVNAGIKKDFLSFMLAEQKKERFSEPEPLDRISKSPCTEVYFWGIPSSGKSCALGGILSAACSSGKVARSFKLDNHCQGYGYMNRLSDLFKANGKVGSLPEGTPTTATYEMALELEDEKNNMHPITFVDLAGELVRCMYKKDAKEELDPEEAKVLLTLTNILKDNKTGNRKMHFFVIEYGGEDREYEGLPQRKYLDAAVTYIEDTKIFEEDTDGLYILISKVDKAQSKGEELKEKLKSYIQEDYATFYNGLQRICKDCNINKGEVQVVPFTLGEVCFEDYCKFQDGAANAVLRIIMERSYGENRDLFGRIGRRLAR